jgi:hypothetical protein
MRLAAPPLGGEDQGLPGGKYHRPLGRGNAGEALQEVEHIVLQTQRFWPQRLGEFPVPDRAGRTDPAASHNPGA